MTVEFTFTPQDTNQFREYVTTITPQSLAAVARAPKWTLADVEKKSTIVVLDNVQDPGNVGTLLRACLGFKASLVLVESAEATNPKTVRASASAIMRVPWVEMKKAEAEEWLQGLSDRTIYRLEKRPGAITPAKLTADRLVLIAGNEGSGIGLSVQGASVAVPHESALDSLNVAMAVTLVLYDRYV
jgi:RNA methyltransferase, TrmH family